MEKEKKSTIVKKIFCPMVLGNCLGMILFVLAVVIGSLFLLDHYTLHGESIKMPELIGKNIDQAKAELEKLGLKAEVADTGFVENIAGDIILDQSVHPGKEIKPGRWIKLVVNSKVERKVALPGDIAGNCSMREAEMKLRSRGFKIGAPQYILGDKNWVYEIKLNGKVLSPGTMVSVHTPLTLVVGDGDVDEEYSGGDDFYEEVFTDSTQVETAEESDDAAELFE